MFAYFISLRFPPRKVKKIVEMLHNAETLSLDHFEKVKNLINFKPKHNKCNFRELYQTNLAYKLIIDKYDVYYSGLEKSKQRKFKRFYKKVTGKNII